jgi:hypothetical protein
MHLFLLWLLQHYIIAILTCGLKEDLAHGVGKLANPIRDAGSVPSFFPSNLQNLSERSQMRSDFPRNMSSNAQD